jgi:hypothetical protein
MSSFSNTFHVFNRRKQVLKKFVLKICENGDGAKLTQFAFGGLQDDVERILKSNAEKSAPLSKPDYFNILYAYYIYNGEYKNGKKQAVICFYQIPIELVLIITIVTIL